MHGLYSTESIKVQHHAWAIQYRVHQNPTPCMGYTVLSPSKCNTMHGLYSTESIKMQHHAWAIQYWVQHNQLLEFDGFGVVTVKCQQQNIKDELCGSKMKPMVFGDLKWNEAKYSSLHAGVIITTNMNNGFVLLWSRSPQCCLIITLQRTTKN